MQVFVIMPFSETSEKHTDSYWNNFFVTLKECMESRIKDKLKETFKSNEVHVKRAEAPQGNMLFGIINDLQESELVVAVLTDHNPNVLYELGLRHCLSKGRTIMLIEKSQKIPFDLGQYGTAEYLDDDSIALQIESGLRQRLDQIIAYPNNPDNPAQDFGLRGGNAPYRNQSGIRVRVVDRMPSEKYDSLPRFYREEDIDKRPLPSAIITFVGEFVNRGAVPITVDSAKLYVTIEEIKLETDELYNEGWIGSGGMRRGINLNYLQPFGLAPGVPQTFGIAFRLSRVVPDSLKVMTAHLELTDSDDKRHTSRLFCVYEYPRYLLTRQMADQLYGPESEDQ